MSRVYDYHLEMEELFADADYQDWMARNNDMSEQDLDDMANSEETKAHNFAKMMLEE